MAKAPSELGQSEIAMADAKWDESKQLKKDKKIRRRTGGHATEWIQRVERASMLSCAKIACGRCCLRLQLQCWRAGIWKALQRHLSAPGTNHCKGHFRFLTRDSDLSGGNFLDRRCQAGDVEIPETPQDHRRT